MSIQSPGPHARRFAGRADSCRPAPAACWSGQGRVLCCLASLVGLLLVTSRGEALPPENEPVVTAEPDPAPAAEQADHGPEAAGGITFPHNDDLRRRLEQIRKEDKSKNLTAVARHVGQLLADPATPDFFLQRDPRKQTSGSFKAELRQILSDLPEGGRAAYEVQFGADARALLDEALANGDEARLREVTLRYLHTRAGYEALYRLGQFHWDRGRPREAAICWEGLSQIPHGAAEYEPRLSLLTAAGWYRAGENAKALRVLQTLKQQHPQATFEFGGRKPQTLFATDEQALPWLAALVGQPAEREAVSAAAWITLRGAPDRNAAFAAKAPFLAPRWSREVSTDPTVMTVLDTAQQSYRERRSTNLPMFHPLAIGDVVLMRTVQGVRAFDLPSGSLLWRYPSEDDDSNSGLERSLWADAAWGPLSSDGEAFFIVEDQVGLYEQILPAGEAPVFGGGFFGAGFAMRKMAMPGMMVQAEGEEVPANTRSTTLSARELRPPRQGNLRWRVGGRDGQDEPRLAGVAFLGPPLASEGRLYTVVEHRGAIRLVVLDAASGQLEWSQELALVEQPIELDPFRRMAGATPSISDKVIVCPTSGGGLVAVDLATQSLLWAYRYPRAPQSRHDPQQGNVPQLEQNGRWVDPSVTIGEGHVVATPLESPLLHCLSLADGRLVWSQPRAENLYVACIHAGKVVLVGKTAITAVSLKDGKPAWPAPLAIPENAPPSGRGVFAGRYYFLPLADSRILQIDLENGTLAGASRSLREIVPGNLIWHQGAFISQGSAYLEVFDELEPLEQQVRHTLESHPQDVAALTRMGQIDLAAGRLAEGIAHLRLAYEATPGPQTRNRLVSALLDGVRAKLPNEEELSAELDRLQTR